MLAIAKEKKRQTMDSIEFQKGDICTVDLRKRFDVAIAMFAVMGYQTTNEALESAFRNAAKHLNPAGLLIFDAWFGPAVIAKKPQDKILVVEEGMDKVIRLTRPELNVMTHTVTVNFTVLHIENDKILTYVEEAHHMRFFFPMELRYFFKVAGFDVLAMLPFMATDGELSDGDWNAMIVAKKA